MSDDVIIVQDLIPIKPLEDLIAQDFGAEGTPERTQFDEECDAFIAEYINNN